MGRSVGLGGRVGWPGLSGISDFVCNRVGMSGTGAAREGPGKSLGKELWATHPPFGRGIWGMYSAGPGMCAALFLSCAPGRHG